MLLIVHRFLYSLSLFISFRFITLSPFSVCFNGTDYSCSHSPLLPRFFSFLSVRFVSRFVQFTPFVLPMFSLSSLALEFASARLFISVALCTPLLWTMSTDKSLGDQSISDNQSNNQSNQSTVLHRDMVGQHKRLLGRRTGGRSRLSRTRTSAAGTKLRLNARRPSRRQSPQNVKKHVIVFFHSVKILPDNVWPTKFTPDRSSTPLCTEP